MREKIVLKNDLNSKPLTLSYSCIFLSNNSRRCIVSVKEELCGRPNYIFLHLYIIDPLIYIPLQYLCTFLPASLLLS